MVAVLAAGISSRTKFPAVKQAKNNSAKSSRTTPSIVSQLPPGPAICRDIGGFADSARPTMTSPVGRYLLQAIDTDLRQLCPGIWWRQASLEYLALVRQSADRPGQVHSRCRLEKGNDSIS
jgi:hypothetical protein